MTPDDFSALATGIGPDVRANTVFETTQFRIGGKAFATLGWPEQGWAVIKVAPSRQTWALSLSEGIAPEPGRRRRAGIVLARLAAVEHAVAAELLAAAFSFAHRADPPQVRSSVSARRSEGAGRSVR